MHHPSFELMYDATRLMEWAQVPFSLSEMRISPEGAIHNHKHYPILRISSRGDRELVWMRQGLIPSYAHDESGADDRSEAHVESLTCTSCYRSAFRRRRCIIPADRVTDLHHGANAPEEICSMQLASKDVFGLAGVWEIWQNESGHAVETFAVVTTLVAPIMHTIAERIPVVIAPMDQDRWLKAPDAYDEPLKLLRPLSLDDFDQWQLQRCFVTA